MFYAEVGEKESTLHACWLRMASIALTSASLFLGFQIARKHSSSNGKILQISMVWKGVFRISFVMSLGCVLQQKTENNVDVQ